MSFCKIIGFTNEILPSLKNLYVFAFTIPQSQNPLGPRMSSKSLKVPIDALVLEPNWDLTSEDSKTVWTTTMAQNDYTVSYTHLRAHETDS